MRKKYYLFVCLVAFFSFLFLGFSLALPEDSAEDWTKSFHFIVKHYHTQTEANTESDGHHSFTTVEGYIVPYGEQYHFYFVKGEERIALSPSQDIPTITDNGIESIDQNTGSIILGIHPIMREDVAIEQFSGISISAGSNTFDSSDSNEIKITYREDTHLAKAYVFYIDFDKTVEGTSDEKVFTDEDGSTSLENDTAYVYTYLSDGTTSDGQQYYVGDIVRTSDGNPVFKAENLPKGLKEDQDVQKIKIYKTVTGLHTDKTVTSVKDGGRSFDVDLETWFANEKSLNVGFIFDASGSMAFAGESLQAVNIKNLGLSEEKVQELLSKAPKNQTPNEYGEIDWDNVFLTPEEQDLVLDKNLTDNSRLGVSGYHYFIYDSREQTKDFTPLAYWDGEEVSEDYTSFPRSNDLIGYYKFEKGPYTDSRRNWLKNSVTGEYAQIVSKLSLSEGGTFVGQDAKDGWPNQPLKMQDGAGVLLRESASGILLDAKPKSGNFTISFTTKKLKDIDEFFDQPVDENQTIAEMMYIGGLSPKDGNFLRFYRNGKTSRKRLRGVQDETDHIVSNVNNVFGTAEQSHVLTYVYDNGLLTSYIDGTLTEPNNNENKEATLTDFNIILNGLQDEYNGAEIAIDDVIVYDAALNQDEIDQLIDAQKVLQPYYAVAAAPKGHSKGEIIGRIDDHFLNSNHQGAPGWYYVTHGTDFTEKMGTAKSMFGTVNTGKNFEMTDDITLPSANVDGLEGGGSGYTYSAPKSNNPQPSLIYVDENGNLRCFFAIKYGTDGYFSSYIYETNDMKYSRVEALQQAYGSFVTMLNESSPASKSSAVRFSTKVFNDDLEKLVLLDWTSNPRESVDILSQTRGNGGLLDYTLNKNNKKEYNYALTGGTYLYTGLQSFKENLATSTSDDADKYIIIFTDGKDDEYNLSQELYGENAIEQARELKEAGYTIYTVFLTSEATKDYPDIEGDNYDLAKEFLLQVSGALDTQEEEKENYFFSISIEGDKEGNSAINQLTKVFTEGILSQIQDKLDGYKVKDYIDPRFNIVSSDKGIYYLNKDGQITIEKTKEKITLTKEKGIPIQVTNNKNTDTEMNQATLYYDSTKQMYYLEWSNQEIPVCMQGSTRLNVLHTQLTLKAKEDFLGGNALLTNGNEANMNYVYHPLDESPSSGTEDMYRIKKQVGAKESTSKENPYPSKGFPRVTVNVSSFSGKNNQEQTIYMGEKLDQNTIIKEIVSSYEDTNDKTNLYWEYLKNYVASSTKYHSLEEILTEIINNKEKGLSIPYSYLTNENGQVGGNLHQQDQLGTLTYVWNPGSVSYPENGITNDSKDRVSTLTVTYQMLPIESTNDAPSRESMVRSMITEKDAQGTSIYSWNRSRKQAAGEEIKENIVTQRNYTTHIASGKIILQLKMNSSLLSVLNGNTIQYQANLIRHLDDGTTQKIGTFHVKWNPSSDGDEEAILIPVELSFNSEFSHLANEGLPIGTYSIEQDKSSDPGIALLAFSDIHNLEITKDNASLFGNSEAANFSAPVHDNETYLGQKGETVYTNNRYALFEINIVPIESGGFSIQKRIMGNQIEESELFEFTITMTSGNDRELDPNTFDIDGNFNGSWTKKGDVWSTVIKLRHNEKITIDKVPVGTQYTIEETKRKDYGLSSAFLDDEKVNLKNYPFQEKIVKDKIQEWLIINSIVASLPFTGGKGIYLLLFIGITLIILSFFFLLLAKKRKKEEEKTIPPENL